MAERVFDLRDDSTSLPSAVIVDTNIIVDRLLVPVLSSVTTPGAARLQRTARKAEFANHFFHRLETDDAIRLVTPTAFGELVHVAISSFLRLDGSRQRPKMSGREVHKSNPGLISTMKPMLRDLSSLLAANRMAFASPDELRPISRANAFAEQLVDMCCAYNLDTGDPQILLEARRLGINSVASMDADMRRASADFDIYTWL